MTDAKGILKTAVFLVLSTGGVIGFMFLASFAALSMTSADEIFPASMVGLLATGFALWLLFSGLRRFKREEWIEVHERRLEDVRTACGAWIGNMLLAPLRILFAVALRATGRSKRSPKRLAH